jgi:pimeloyl-ACP methyl ester carboxylesterase
VPFAAECGYRCRHCRKPISWKITLAANPAASRPTLPPALGGERRELDSAAGRLAYYVDAPALPPADGTAAPSPLLLIHSINASGSAYEMKPLYDHYRRLRPVYALDLPGFGFSNRSQRPYLPRLMTDAVRAMTVEIRRQNGNAPVDALALSLSSEYLARAAVEVPSDFRRLGLVSPTGFNRLLPRNGPPGSDRGIAWLYRVLTVPLWRSALFGLLTRPAVIRYFLERTWGSKQIDEGLWAYDLLTTRQPGAANAPFYFLSAFLFSADISRVYDGLTMPVWMVHGVRGDFVDFRYKAVLAAAKNWRFSVLPTGALPYFEEPAEFIRQFDAFLGESAGPA